MSAAGIQDRAADVPAPLAAAPAQAYDAITSGPLQALATTLPAGLFPSGPPAPPLAHWLFFLPRARGEDLGVDGHPKRDAAMPDASLPRRMWAGSSLRFLRPMELGAAVTRTSRLVAVSERTGRSGHLAFVQIDHEITDQRGLLVTERQDIVYREPVRPDAPSPAEVPAPYNPQWRRRIAPDTVLLFRYSALTFNSHRIHYDRPYAVDCEGYAGLVVHGPLLATLMLYELLAQSPGRELATFEFRAVKPVIDIAPFEICGSITRDGLAELFVADSGGALCMRATATFRDDLKA